MTCFVIQLYRDGEWIDSSIRPYQFINLNDARKELQIRKREIAYKQYVFRIIVRLDRVIPEEE